MTTSLFALFSSSSSSSSSSSGGAMMIVWIVVLFVLIWFMMMRPQKKQEKAKKAMLETMEIGDTVLTSSGFYGTLIDVADDTVIVEFGNNKNCRIPMQKSAITDIEKAYDATEEEKKDEKEK